MPQIVLLTVDHIVNEVHRLRRPVMLSPGGKKTPTTLPERVAKLYIAKTGELHLPRLAGITTAPLLGGDGNIRTINGYDPETRQYCANVPALAVPERPTEQHAKDGLFLLRTAFRTFPFADSERIWDKHLKLELVDLTKGPGLDESAFIAALMTGVCRAFLYLAPGVMIVAPADGSGSGKGLLARAISLIVFGLRPVPFEPGKGEDQEKRIATTLLEGRPVVFFDNINEAILSSPTLEQAMTERPFAVRLLHTQKNAVLDGAPLIIVTGNGLSPSQDLVRRFGGMFIRLDARIENPALRRFPLADRAFLGDIERRRAELLGALLTIWRFGRQNRPEVGLPLGSYDDWERWCRNPLLTLGCRDPVERLEELAAADPRRQNKLAIFTAWWRRHRDAPVTAKDLHEEVKS